MPMPNRQMVGGELYRYAFQGQEKDPETGKEAFQLRLWDGRIGRWLTTDPAGQYASPYLGMGNNPISRIDPDGGCDQPDSNCGWFKRLFYSSSSIEQWNFWKEAGFTNNDMLLDEMFLNPAGGYSSGELPTSTSDYSGRAGGIVQGYTNNSGRFSINNTLSFAGYGAENKDIGVGGIDANAYFNLASTDINAQYGSKNNYINLNANGQIGALEASIQHGIINDHRQGFVTGLEAGAYAVRGETTLTGSFIVPLTPVKTQIRANIGGSALSAHVGGKLQAYYNQNTKMYHIVGFGHFGFGLGAKVGVDMAIGFN